VWEAKRNQIFLHSPSESPFVENSTHPKKSMNILFFGYHSIFFIDCLHESATQDFPSTHLRNSALAKDKGGENHLESQSSRVPTFIGVD
jgi:hypothetical protein